MPTMPISDVSFALANGPDPDLAEMRAYLDGASSGNSPGKTDRQIVQAILEYIYPS
jgi:hypothetical protein